MGIELFPRRMFYGSISLKKAEKMQDRMESKITELKYYNPRIKKNKN